MLSWFHWWVTHASTLSLLHIIKVELTHTISSMEIMIRMLHFNFEFTKEKYYWLVSAFKWAYRDSSGVTHVTWSGREKVTFVTCQWAIFGAQCCTDFHSILPGIMVSRNFIRRQSYLIKRTRTSSVGKVLIRAKYLQLDLQMFFLA